jgi:hypothetical protein
MEGNNLLYCNEIENKEKHEERPKELKSVRKSRRGVYFLLFCITIIIGGGLGISTEHKYVEFIRQYQQEPPQEPTVEEMMIRTDGLKEIVRYGNNFHFKHIEDLLNKFYQKHNRYPTNNEGLFTVIPFLKNTNRSHGISADSSIPMSRWRIPYVYENRREFDEKLFRMSPVNRDHEGIYSHKIDNGIYIYSVGGMIRNKRLSPIYNNQLIKVNVIRGITALLLVLFPILIIFETLKRREFLKEPRLLRRIGIVLIIFISAVLLRPELSRLTERHVGTYYPLRVYDSCAPIEIRKPYFIIINNYVNKGILKQSTLEVLKQIVQKEVELKKKETQ